MKPRTLALPLVLLLSIPAAAETIEGVVTNGTNGHAQAGATVEVLKLDQGMEPIAQTTTDAAGHYTLANLPLPGGGAPYLVRVAYEGVNYHQAARFQDSTTARADVEVFEKTSSEKDLRVDIHGLSLEPAEAQLGVSEIFMVQNNTRPPKTIFHEGGTFRYAIPPKARDVSLSVAGPTGMPLEQTPVEGKQVGQYLVDFALRPGATTIRLRYRLDYPDARLAFSLAAFYPVTHTQVFIPTEGVQLSSKTLQPLGTVPESRMLAYGAEGLGAGARLEFEVSGKAPGSARETAPTEEGPSPGSPGSVTIFPNDVAQARWYILAFTFFVLVLGLYYLYMTDRGSESRPADPALAKKRRKDRAAEQVDDQTLARH